MGARRTLALNIIQPRVSGDLLHRLSKLRGRSWDELRERSAQLVSSRLERAGPLARRIERATVAPDEYLAGRLVGAASPEALLAAFRARKPPRFFSAFADQARTTAALRRLGGSAADRVVDEANRVCAGHIRLLGYDDVPVGVAPDWHLDPLLGRRAPMTHWSRIPFLDASIVGDHKLVWELNRHQYFGTLGRAYWRTGDERYAETFARHVDSWMTENPTKRGVNWASSLELAFRAISWCWALHFFRHSATLTAPLYARMLASVDAHARHIARYLSTYFSPNTHLTGEALGLFYIGTVFPELRLASRWRDQGARILVEQLGAHVRADGVYFEQTTYYHRYTADFYTHFLLLASVEGISVRERVVPGLEALLDCLMYMTRPDGRTPLIGDDDGGRLMGLDERAPNDFRSTLSTGAVMLGRADYAHVAGPLAEETLWLVGPDAVERWEKLGSREPDAASRAFPDGGYFVLRDDWTRDAQFALIDCGPHGMMNCGHAHADALSVEIAADGRPWIVDPGTYTYTTSPADRDHFRHAGAHSTVTVDGASSSETAGAFSWTTTARSSMTAWQAHPQFTYFSGWHDGFARLWAGAVHRRDVLHLPGKYWIIRDRVTAPGHHDVRHHFQFAPDLRVDVVDATAVVASSTMPPGHLQLRALADAGHFELRDGWVSSGYGVRSPASSVAFAVAAEGASDVVTLVLPGSTVSADARVTRERFGATTAIELHHGDVIDVLLLDATDAVVTHGVSADASCAWVRVDGRTGDAIEFVSLGVRSLALGASRLVFGGAVGYAVGRRGPDGWVVDSNAPDTRIEDGMLADGRPRLTVTR
ncbi:MAG: putative Heparinase family protein [Geminicoccaceae bacterium]|nr:putative Heparinase family protein [Geminicoccaceae bacterium]